MEHLIRRITAKRCYWSRVRRQTSYHCSTESKYIFKLGLYRLIRVRTACRNARALYIYGPRLSLQLYPIPDSNSFHLQWTTCVHHQPYLFKVHVLITHWPFLPLSLSVSSYQHHESMIEKVTCQISGGESRDGTCIMRLPSFHRCYCRGRTSAGCRQPAVRVRRGGASQEWQFSSFY